MSSFHTWVKGALAATAVNSEGPEDTTRDRRWRLTAAETRLIVAMREAPGTSEELGTRIGVKPRRVRQLLEGVEAKGFWLERFAGCVYHLLAEPDPDRLCPRCRAQGRGNVRLAFDNPGPLCGPCMRAVLRASVVEPLEEEYGEYEGPKGSTSGDAFGTVGQTQSQGVLREPNDS